MAAKPPSMGLEQTDLATNIVPEEVVPEEVLPEEAVPENILSEEAVPEEESNLLFNAGFEDVAPTANANNEVEAAYWSTSGDVTLDSDIVDSGQYAVRVQAENSTSSITSELFEVTPHSRVEFTGMFKAQDVVSPGSYFQLRVTIAAYGADQETKIRHWDIVSTSGSFDWQKVQDAIIVPESARYMRLRLSLTECSGTFWADNLNVRVVQESLAQNKSSDQSVPTLGGYSMGAIIPQPWKVDQSEISYPLGRLAILIEEDSGFSPPWLLAEIEEFLTVASIDYEVIPTSLIDQTTIDFILTEKSVESLLVFGDQANEVLAKQLESIDSEVAWSDLSREGYFLSIEPSAVDVNKAVLYIGANRNRGQFYGVQTLKQLIDENKQIPQLTVIDRPTMARRGTPVGLQWYREPELLMDRLASLKFNFLWTQGTFEDQLLWYRWREPLTESSKQGIREYITLARHHYITPFISIGPRGEDPTNATIYSSEDSIVAVVRKMEELYELGVRHFGLSFDDLSNVDQNVLFGQDIDKFEHIGEAHTYFVNEIYQRFSAQHDDIEMMIVPMVYNGIGYLSDTDEAYLSAIGTLPTEIGLYTSLAYQQDAEAALRLTDRKHLVWDNFWASFYSPENPTPRAALPLKRSLAEESINGYSFMPVVPDAEGALLISWQSAANFAWAPSRYVNPN